MFYYGAVVQMTVFRPKFGVTFAKHFYGSEVEHLPVTHGRVVVLAQSRACFYSVKKHFRGRQLIFFGGLSWIFLALFVTRSNHCRVGV